MAVPQDAKIVVLTKESLHAAGVLEGQILEYLQTHPSNGDPRTYRIEPPLPAQAVIDEAVKRLRRGCWAVRVRYEGDIALISLK